MEGRGGSTGPGVSQRSKATTWVHGTEAKDVAILNALGGLRGGNHDHELDEGDDKADPAGKDYEVKGRRWSPGQTSQSMVQFGSAGF